MKRYSYITNILRERKRYIATTNTLLSNLELTVNDIYNDLEGKDLLARKLIKMGALIFILPILGISELIGILLMAIGGIIGIFRRKYPIKKVGKDLRQQIETLKEFRKELTP